MGRWQPPTLDEVAYIYENTTPNAKIRSLYIQWLAYHVAPDYTFNNRFRERLIQEPEIAADLTLALTNRIVAGIKHDPFEELLFTQSYDETYETDTEGSDYVDSEYI